MRTQPFLDTLDQYFPHDQRQAADYLARNGLEGGWEIWMQVEMALTFVFNNTFDVCHREDAYPAPPRWPNQWLTIQNGNKVDHTTNQNQAARCDFHLFRNANMRDDTYLELKCINVRAAQSPQAAQTDAWQRFGQDIQKVRLLDQYYRANGSALPSFCLLATFDTPAAVNQQPLDGLSVYVWDPLSQTGPRVHASISTIPNPQTPRLLVVAAA